MPEDDVAIVSRRNALRLAGAGLAATALAPRAASAQLAEEANTEPLNIVRKGIDRKLDVYNIDLLEEQAKQVYGHGTYVFVANGSGKMWTLAENQRAWGDYVFTPHRMRGVVREQIDLSVDLLGLELPHPLIITPFGSHGLHHPLAEVATARGIAMSGGLLTVSSASTASMEDIANASTGPKWFQIYLTIDDGVNRGVLERAKAAGFKAIVLTVDAIGQGSSDEYQRLGRPRPWLPYGNFPDANQPPFKTDLGWKDVEMIRNVTGLPVIVKGITRPDDARAAISAGAAAIQVSNHGGRALDGTPAAITALRPVADVVKGDVPIILDSGIRRGCRQGAGAGRPGGRHRAAGHVRPGARRGERCRQRHPVPAPRDRRYRAALRGQRDRRARRRPCAAGRGPRFARPAQGRRGAAGLNGPSPAWWPAGTVSESSQRRASAAASGGSAPSTPIAHASSSGRKPSCVSSWRSSTAISASDASSPRALRARTRSRSNAGSARQSRMPNGTRSSRARARKSSRSAARRKAASTITG